MLSSCTYYCMLHHAFIMYLLLYASPCSHHVLITVCFTMLSSCTYYCMLHHALIMYLLLYASPCSHHVLITVCFKQGCPSPLAAYFPPSSAKYINFFSIFVLLVSPYFDRYAFTHRTLHLLTRRPWLHDT